MEAPPIPAMDADHPDLYIPEPVKVFLPYFQRVVVDKVLFLSELFHSFAKFYIYLCISVYSRGPVTSTLNIGKLH